MDFDFDLDDLGDLENLDNDWDNLAPDQPSPQQRQQEVANTGHYQSQGSHEGSAQAQDSQHGSGHSNSEAFQIRLDREREGRCADCGAQTHEVQFDPSGSGRSIKVPLSVPGEVHRGRCLFCHPLPSAAASSSRSRRRGERSSTSKSSRQRQRGYEDEGGLEQHFQNTRQQQAYQQGGINSSASVCSHHSGGAASTYSHQSAPTWVGGQSHSQQASPFQTQSSNSSGGYGADYGENYQQQQCVVQQHMQQQQQQQYPDDGSVGGYSQASHQSHHSIHSQQSYHSNTSYSHSYNQLASPLSNPPNIDQRFNRTVSSASSLNANDPNANAAAAEVIYRQMREETLDFEKVLQAMRRFPAHAPIQEKGTAVIWNQTNNADVCQALTNVGGVNIILDAMRNHPLAPNVQHAGCEGLRNLCIIGVNREVVLRGGGVPLLVEMMQRHVDNPEIQRSGCTALASVAEGGMEFKIAVAECGGILAVMKAVEIHPENDLVLRAAYQALRTLGYNPGAKGD